MTNSSTLDDISGLVKTLKDEAETGVKDSDSALSRVKDFAIMSNAHAADAKAALTVAWATASAAACARATAAIYAAAAERSAKADAAAESARGAVVFWDKTMKASVTAARLAVDNYASYLSNAPKEVVALS